MAQYFLVQRAAEHAGTIGTTLPLINNPNDSLSFNNSDNI